MDSLRACRKQSEGEAQWQDRPRLRQASTISSASASGPPIGFSIWIALTVGQAAQAST
jgi:hypothetical protein